MTITPGMQRGYLIWYLLYNYYHWIGASAVRL